MFLQKIHISILLGKNWAFSWNHMSCLLTRQGEHIEINKTCVFYVSGSLKTGCRNKWQHRGTLKSSKQNETRLVFKFSEAWCVSLSVIYVQIIMSSTCLIWVISWLKLNHRGFINGLALGKLNTWFDHLEERFLLLRSSHQKTFACLWTSCSPAGKVNETPESIWVEKESQNLMCLMVLRDIGIKV